MKCKGCGKEINEDEVFCDDCKKLLQESSSKRDVEQLEELITEQEKLNDLEDTKELETLSNLDDTKVVDDLNTIEDDVNVSLKEARHKRKDNKKIIIIIVLAIVALALVLSFILILLNKPKEKENTKVEPEILDYQKIINEYGTLIEEKSKSYVIENNDILTWQKLIELVPYTDYDISCDTHNIYSDGTIYLASCKVNDVNVTYTYGNLKEEEKEGREITIYRLDYDNNFYSYTDRRNNGAKEVATITCKTTDCKYINAYDKYVLIKEDNKYNLYNYENNSIEFGPFDMYDDYSYATDLLVNNNTLYGVFYKENDQYNIYNILTGKTFKNVRGQLLIDEMNFSPSTMYKYNYAVLEEDGTYNFMNLKTGNISYAITGNLSSFIEDEKNSIVYMTVYDEYSDKFMLYNSNGKLLFDGNEYSKICVDDGLLIVANDNTYQVYDSKLKLKTSSKAYDLILALYSDFIAVIDNNILNIVDINDVHLATLDLNWDKDRYIFQSSISGWYDGVIYLLFEDNSVPYGTLGHGLEYYYIPETKESGLIKMTGLDGDIKPVS